MRWVTYASAGGDRVGLVEDGTVHGLEPGVPMVDVLDAPGGLAAAGERARTAPSESVPLAGLTLRAPLQPRSIRDCTGFLQHLRNCSAAADLQVDERFARYPAFYFSNPAAVVGPHDDVPVSPGCERFDFELEVCAVIGTTGSHLPREQAEEHIAGYAIFCDWSARDLQLDEMALGLGPAKGKDGANTIGPMLVTPDELEPFRAGNAFDLAMTAHVNGRPVGEGRWSTIDWGFPDMITHVSRGTTLRPVLGG